MKFTEIKKTLKSVATKEVEIAGGKVTESHELNAICCAIVTAERLLASVVASEPNCCQCCGAEKQLVKSGSLWLCCDCIVVFCC